MFIKKLSASLMGACLVTLGMGRIVFAEVEVSQEVEAGFQQKKIDTPEAKFEEYKEVPNGVLLKRYKLNVEKGKTSVELEVRDIRQEDQSAYVTVETPKYEIEISWDQSPHIFSQGTTASAWKETSAGVFELPDAIQGASESMDDQAGFRLFMSTYIFDASRAVDLGFRQDTGKVKLGYSPMKNVKLNLSFARKYTKGSKATSFSLGRDHTVELPQPLDYRTYDTEVSASYADKTKQFGFNYSLSSFRNDIRVVVWDNMKRLTDRDNGNRSDGDGTSRGRYSTAPNNIAHNVNLNSGYNLPFWKSRLTAYVSWGVMTQNDTLLPYGINSAILSATGFDSTNAANLPEQNANAKMVTWTQNYAFTARPIKPVKIGVKYRSFQLGNKTSEVNFPGHVDVDADWYTTAKTNKAFDYRKDKVSLDVGWQIIRSLSWGVNYSRERINREHREVAESKENTIAVNTDYKPFSWMLVRASYINARREVDEFHITELVRPNPNDASDVEIPGLRRYDSAARRRNQGSVLVQLTPGPVAVSLNGALAHDKYGAGKGDLSGGNATFTNHMYGLLENRMLDAGLDLDWSACERAGVFAFYNAHRDRAIQRGNQSGGAGVIQDAVNDWNLRVINRFDTLGVGTDIVAIKDRLDIQLGYDMTFSRGAQSFFDLGSSQIGLVDPPVTKSLLQDISLKGEVQIRKGLSISLGYVFEKFDVADFAKEGLTVFSGTAANQEIFYLADNINDYRAHIGTILVKYKW